MSCTLTSEQSLISKERSFEKSILRSIDLKCLCPLGHDSDGQKFVTIMSPKSERKVIEITKIGVVSEVDVERITTGGYRFRHIRLLDRYFRRYNGAAEVEDVDIKSEVKNTPFKLVLCGLCRIFPKITMSMTIAKFKISRQQLGRIITGLSRCEEIIFSLCTLDLEKFKLKDMDYNIHKLVFKFCFEKTSKKQIGDEYESTKLLELIRNSSLQNSLKKLEFKDCFFEHSQEATTKLYKL
ncbi:unnamed protein product [Moneuplotes crassus]|uniref:Uncharacterized protein n=1 Tax=Euplotes crassus TaxID=5936 RepID=A0AAD1XLA0_EUPCR|nr:unnamed protein product [Moneuplotes crassus]